MAMPHPDANTKDDAAKRTESGITVTVHGEDTKNLERSLDQLSHHPNAPGLMRLVSPLSLMEPVGANIQNDHDHGPEKRSFPAAVASAVINHMLMFGMCCAYGMIIFSEEKHSDHRALGVKMCLVAAFVAGGLMSICSGIPVAIGGTDLNPAVFYGDFVIAIATELSKQLQLDGYDYADWEGSSGRRLAKVDKTKYFCKGGHLAQFANECATYHEELRATTIFAVAFSTLLLAILWTVLGKLKLTRYVSYMPYSISEAFLACVGYKVFYYALKFCDMQPQQFMPAALIGIALYFVKALHLGNPTIMMPLGLLVPLGVFWGIVFGMGDTPTTMRDQGWLFPIVGNEPFWWVWTDSLGKYGSINFSAWVTTLPNLVVMIIVSTMDCVLKIHATPSKLPLRVDSDKECLKFGSFNYILACCGGATGYMQLKFNVISYGVMRNAHDRRASMIYAMLCAACYFSTVEHFNYLPKFFLSALLFFAGAGFVTDNLWGSRKFLHVSEWLEIVIIVIVFIIAGQSMIFAVLTGVLLSGVAFIAKYARVPAITGRPRKGDEVTTRDRPVGEVGHQSFMHIASEWVMIVNLKGYVFFSSCVSIVQRIESHFNREDRHDVPSYRRLKFLVFDAKSLDGMDASGAMSMLKLTRKAQQRGIRVCWAGVSDELAEEMQVRQIMKEQDRFQDLHSAMTHLEKRILQYKAQQQREWMHLHPAFCRDKKLMDQRVDFEPFREVFLSDGARMGCPWRYCSRLSIKSFKTMLCVPGDLHRPLYLIHTGAIAILDAVPEEGKEWQTPRFVLRQGWFVNANSLVGQPSNGYAVAVEDGEVLFWTEEQWWKMANEHPLMMMELSKAVMRQQGSHHLQRDPEARISEQIAISPDVGEEAKVTNPILPILEEDSEEEEAFDSQDDEDGVPLENHMLTKVASAKEIRRTKDVLCTPIVLGDAFNRETLTKLPQLQTRILEMHFARALGELGFFRKDPSDEGILPQLPRILLDDLRVAFFTFAQRPDDDPKAVPILPKRRVIDALLYVGIFHVLAEDVNLTDLSLDEFLELGRESHLARLRKPQLEQIEELCKTHEHEVNGQIMLLVTDVSRMLEKLLGIEMDFAINDAVTHAWGQETWPDTHVTHEQFAGIVSWYVKRRERDWNVLEGIFDLLGCEKLTGDLTPQLLQECRTRHSDECLEDETAVEEMLWAADWIRRGEGGGKALDTCSLFTVFLTNLQRGKGVLPPKCVLSEEGVRPNRAWKRHEYRGQKSRAASFYIRESFSRRLLVEDDAPKAAISQSTFGGGAPKWAECVVDHFERPETSPSARCVVYSMLCVVVLSVLAVVLEPMISGGNKEEYSPEEYAFWLSLDIFFAVVFTLELLLRLIANMAAQPKAKCWAFFAFFSDPMNVLDFIAVTEIYLDHVFQLPVLRTLLLERFARLGRVLKLCKLRTYGCPFVAPLTATLVVIMGTYMLEGANLNLFGR